MTNPLHQCESHKVHAWQWTGSTSLLQYLTTEWGLKVTHVAPMSENLWFEGTDTEEPEMATVGDYLVTPDEGCTFTVMDADYFERTFEEAE